MAMQPGSAAAEGFGNIDVATEAMVFFARRGQEAATRLKDTMDSARKDARTKLEVEAETKRLQDRLNALLADIGEDKKPGNFDQINKLLKDMADNQKLSDPQRQHARELIDTLNASKTGDLLHSSLTATQFEKFRALANKYRNSTGPVSDNTRAGVLSWISLYTGNKNGLPYIGTPTSQPKASTEDIQFVNETRNYLNERQKITTTPDWASVNPQLKALLSAHFESIKPAAVIEDDTVRNVMVQLALQDFNNAVNGSSASSKAIHDTKKGVTDRI